MAYQDRERATKAMWAELQRRQAQREIIVYQPSVYDAPSNNPEIKHLKIRNREES
jgi:hypothetical protein